MITVVMFNLPEGRGVYNVSVKHDPEHWRTDPTKISVEVVGPRGMVLDPAWYKELGEALIHLYSVARPEEGMVNL